MEFGGGSLGYLRDGTIMRLEHNTVEATQRTWDKYVGPFHLVMQEDDPTFRLRTWRSNGEPIDSIEFKIAGLPWETASYQTYAKILDLDDGSLLAAMEAQVGPPRKTDDIRARRPAPLGDHHDDVHRPVARPRPNVGTSSPPSDPKR